MAVTWKKKPLVGNQKNPSKPDPDGLKPKAVKWQKKHQVEKTTTTKKTWKPEPDGLKPKAVAWKKKSKNKKSHQSQTPTAPARGIKPKALKWKEKPEVEKQKNSIEA